ncbi:multidrug transporter [Pseudomonas sp. PD9R]|uniref:multidrug transporter n=1 Tax=Pseudomonas sp. PD9R TaxID=2853534 RepID=UPI001C43D33B|nr:multidrug transporter [Pseudomonas sp. PD9R]MBV6826996.1 multidrug transporter [Pseudomonas sp. PD9R]
MNRCRTLVAALLLSIAATATASSGSGDPLYTIQNPPAYAMIGDLLIARPLLVVATVIGAGVFVVSLPFTALGGGVGDAGQALVVDPAKAAFVRCLGCIGEGFERQE